MVDHHHVVVVGTKEEYYESQKASEWDDVKDPVKPKSNFICLEEFSNLICR